jgi:hypothetical protein
MSGRYIEVRGLQPGPVYGLKVVAVVTNCEAEGGRPQHFPKIYVYVYFLSFCFRKLFTKMFETRSNYFTSKFAITVHIV